jgi:hypothetical protein
LILSPTKLRYRQRFVGLKNLPIPFSDALPDESFGKCTFISAAAVELVVTQPLRTAVTRLAARASYPRIFGPTMRLDNGI